MSESNVSKCIRCVQIYNKRLKISVTEIHFDKEYCVEFPTNAGNLKLIIELNSKFPLEKPRMKVHPIIIHKWVDINGEIVLAPGLTNVNMFLEIITHKCKVNDLIFVFSIPFILI